MRVEFLSICVLFVVVVGNVNKDEDTSPYASSSGYFGEVHNKTEPLPIDSMSFMSRQAIANVPLGQECNNYKNLSNPDRAERAVTSVDAELCDRRYFNPGWYRFTGDAGDRIATSCVPILRCTAAATGWMNGSHPTNSSIVVRDVCFNWDENCCAVKVKIRVKLCGSFYIYELPPTEKCYLRYCGNAVGLMKKPSKCGGDVTSLSGQITSPGYPTFTEPITCHWTIKSAFDGNILLYFEEMKLGHGGCLSNNLTIDGDKTDTFCHGKDLNPLSILVAKSSVNIYYKSVYWNKKPGFKLRYLMLKKGLNNVPTQSQWKISVQVNGPSVISVSWGAFDKSYIGSTQNVYGLVVVCKPLRHITRSVHAIAQLNVTAISITGLTGNTEYQVQVVALVKDRNAVTLSMYGSQTARITTNKGECENYRNLTSVRRSQNAPGGPYCDQTKLYTPAWYRFAGQAGTQIATSCVPIDRCFTKSPGWMDGIHPAAQDGAVMRTVCFHRLGDCCRWKATIRVRDCGGFFVYQLHRPPICKLGYCGNHGGCWKLIKDTTGTLTSPGYPRRMYWNSKCLWDFTAPSSSGVIVVVVEDLRIPQSASCLKFSLSFKNNIGEQVGQACGVQRFFTWMSRESAKLKFISHQADSRWVGFKARYFIFNYDLTNIPVNSQWTNVSAQAMNSSATTVQWGPYRASPGSPSITEYIIICVPDGLPLNVTVFTTDVSQNSLVVTGLMGYTSYTVQIVVQTNGKESGFNDYSGSQKTSVTTKEGVPSEGPSEIKVTNTSKYDRVKVSWRPIPKHARNGIITSFEIYYKKASTQTWSKLTVSNPVEITAYLDSLEPGQYVLRIAGATSVGVGSKSKTISFIVGAPPLPDKDIDMYLHGESTGDNMIPSTDDYFATCFRVNIPGDGFPFFKKRHHMIHICRNGLLLFETSRAIRWPYRFAENRQWLRDASLLAPYWADIDPQRSFSRGISKVYYQAYDDTDNSWISQKMIKQATYDVETLHIDRSNLLYKHAYTRIKSFTAKWVLVITWVNLRPFGVDRLGVDLNNTFQAVLITDGIHSFAMYNYAPNGIQWAAPTKGNYKGYPGLPVVGWNVGRGEEERYDVEGSGQIAISGIDTRYGKTVNIERLDVRQDTILRHGKWFFRLETAIPNRGSHERQKCVSWLQTAPVHEDFTKNLEPCPCTLVQAEWDKRFELDSEGWPFTCAKSVFKSTQKWEQKCCYYVFTGALVKGYPGGGYPISFQIYTGRMKYDDYIYEKCCVSSSLCKSFYKRRPSDNCRRYRNPKWCWLWGDPHFVTLDGMNYTFNGLGEYIMADVSNGLFQLQARTKLAKGEGKATVFVSAVAKQNGTSAVQVNLKTGQGLEVLVNGSVIDHSTLTNSTTLFNGSVALSRPDDSSILLSFPCGISVKVTDVKDSLAILLAAPQRFKNKTRGLLGVWNDDPLDDLTTPTGHVLPTNATGRMIHHDFGQKWQVTDNNSLFTYNKGEGVNTFSNSSFEPMFIEDFKFANKTLEKEALEKCEGDVNCLFDAALTNDVSMGTSTKIVGSTFKNESNVLKNSAPMFLNDSLVIYVTVNTTARIEIFAKDDDGDPLTFNVSGILPENLNINTDSSTSVVLSWKVTFAKVKFEITVMDDKGAAALLRAKVHVCACHNGGYCSKDTNSNNVFADSSNDTFLIMPCTCIHGYTGRFCENDLDACQANLNPCYPGVKCTDLPPPANVSGYKCGPCPQGFSRDGATCIDLDECTSGNDGCSQICVNTPGSFVCDCKHGYRLSFNQKTCNDVDECYPSSDCMQKCTNTIGNYTCECDEGFKVDPRNPKKCIPKLPCTDGDHGCQDICYMKGGQKQCACNQGYKLKDDQKTCEDINECDPKIKRCSQYCNNTEGSYKCWCKKGFRLNADKITCKDVDECFELTYKCPDPSQICSNTEGTYKCICSQGLFLTANKTCREIDGPLPTKKPEPPKTPTENEKRNSVNITVQGLDVDDWFVALETSFKEAVAKAVTSYCASKTKDCKKQRKRERRALDYILYTADQVHLLPGFPKEINPTSRDLAAVIAFYVEFPPEIVSSSGDSIEGGILVEIVQSASAKEAIEKALNNRTISRVTLFIMVQPTTTPTDKPDSLPIIIGASVGGLLLIVIVAVVLRKFVCKDKRIKDGRREERERGKNNGGETFGLYVVKQSSSNNYEQLGKENRGMDDGDYSDVVAEKPDTGETSSKKSEKHDAEEKKSGAAEKPATADADHHQYSKKLENPQGESSS